MLINSNPIIPNGIINTIPIRLWMRFAVCMGKWANGVYSPLQKDENKAKIKR